MSVNTKVRLLGRVEPEEIIDYIKKHWNVDEVINDVKKYKVSQKFEEEIRRETKEFYDKNEEMYNKDGHINYMYKDEIRNLFYSYSSYNTYENLDYYREEGLENMVKTETTYLSLGYWGYSVEMMKDLVSYFGGWLEESDNFGNNPYYYIEGTKPKINPIPVIHITREELNNKFGGIVVIDDDYKY